MPIEVAIVGATRTPVGAFGKGLAAIPAPDLGATVIRSLLAQTGVPAEIVDEVIMGQVLTGGSGQNPARQAAIKGGLPVTTSAFTINKVCGSGLKAVQLAAQSIQCGDATVVIAGGQENMSAAPHVLPTSRTGCRMGDMTLVDTMIKDGLWDAFNDYHMGITAENVARQYGLTRDDQDEFAARSQAKVKDAVAAGRFAEEITPVDTAKGGRVLVDEFPRPDTTTSSLKRLKPAFQKDAEGTVTAGNASGVNDGAAAVLLMSMDKAQELGITPLATISGAASAGVDPSVMGLGPVPAVRKCLQKCGWTPNSVDLYELNEAFAAQSLAVVRDLEVDPARVNVNGGAIALGHPIGASGCRILVTLLHELRRRGGGGRGVAALCIGGGQGIALAVTATPLQSAGLLRLVEGVSLTEPAAQDEAWNRLRGNQEVQESSFRAIRELYDAVFADRPVAVGPPVVWQPDDVMKQGCNLGRLMKAIGVDTVEAAHRWSRRERDGFWRQYVMGRVQFHKPPTAMIEIAEGGIETPRWLPGAEMNIAQSCLRGGGDPAVVWASEEDPTKVHTVTNEEFQGQVHRVARALHQHGFSAGSRIAIFMPMTLESVVIYMGIIAAGCAAVSIADSYAAPEISSRMRLAEADAMFTVDAFFRGGKRINMLSKAVEAGVGRVIVLPLDPEQPPTLRSEDVLWGPFLDSVLSDTNAEPFTYHNVEPSTISNVLFSSGTTGDPKVIPWTHITPIKSALDAHYHQDIRAGDVVCWPTNIGWMMGPWLMYAALLNRATLALWVGAPTGGLGKFVEAARVTMLGLVPGMVKNWRASRCMEGNDWSSVRCFSSSGERSSPTDYLYLMWLAKLQAPVIEYCGGTEIGGGYISGTMMQPAALSCFTGPCMGSDFALLTDEGSLAVRGEEGECYVLPPWMGLSQVLLNADHHRVYYANCPTSPLPGETLRRHGDQLRYLPNGFYESLGRSDNTMNLGGIKVSSADLERVFVGHSEVSDVAAVAVQPPGGGADLLVVYIVPDSTNVANPPDTVVLKSDLQRLLSEHLNPLFRVHDVQLIEVLPKTASNKTMHRELRALYKATHQTAA